MELVWRTCWFSCDGPGGELRGASMPLGLCGREPGLRGAGLMDRPPAGDCGRPPCGVPGRPAGDCGRGAMTPIGPLMGPIGPPGPIRPGPPCGVMGRPCGVIGRPWGVIGRPWGAMLRPCGVIGRPPLGLTGGPMRPPPGGGRGLTGRVDRHVRGTTPCSERSRRIHRA